MIVAVLLCILLAKMGRGGRAFNGSRRHVHHATIIVKAQLPIALHMGPMQRLAIVLGNAQCRVVVVVVVVDVLTPMLWHLDRSSCSHSCIATSGICCCACRDAHQLVVRSFWS